MNLPEVYDYLVRTRRELWSALEAVPDDVLARPLLDGRKFHCIKDLVFHVPTVEDGWINLDILRRAPVLQTDPALKDCEDGPFFADVPLADLLAYWRAVEEHTRGYLATLTADELGRGVPVEGWGASVKVDGLLWHVAIHEIRHTAQIVVLLRTQGIKPPTLDLLWHLPTT